MMRLFVICVAAFSAASTLAQEKKAPPTVADLITQAEAHFYAVEKPDHLDQADRVIDEIVKINPREPYVHWGRARTVFFRKELFYTDKTITNPDELNRRKLELANLCHRHADTCIAIAPSNPECHLMKGSCYAMQASTWGVGFRSLRVAKPIDIQWEKAMELTSKFKHVGNITTKDLAQILRGILYRAMPESWWFRFVAGIRGDKQQAYFWMKDAVHGLLLKEPLIVIEYAATTLCYGQTSHNNDLISEGMKLIDHGLALPTRFPMDDFDKKNLAILRRKPHEACNYRRERFENLSEEAFRKLTVK